MEITSIRCALQIGLLGAVTKNLRRVRTLKNDKLLNIYFYFDQEISAIEYDLSAIVADKVIAYFENNVEVKVHLSIIPLPQVISPLGENEISIFSRWIPPLKNRF